VITVIVARSVEDYHACGAAIPPDRAILPCANCEREIAVSPTGVDLIDTKVREGIRVIALCNPCAAAGAKPGDTIDVGPEGAAQIARNAQAKALHEFMLARVKK
jgi:hypothetical protein